MSDMFERAALLEVDFEGGASYVTVGDEHVARTVPYNGVVSLDLDSDGNVVGIELLTALKVK